jgi:hypothetical protein
MRTMPTRRHVLAACAAAFAGAAQAATAPPTDPYSFRFEWLEGGGGAGADAQLDLGAVAATPAAIRSGRILVTRRVAVRIDGAGNAVRLLVALGAEAPGCTMRLDGMALSTIPRVIDAAHRVGTPVVHQLEIAIPRGVPAGRFLANLQWQAEPL